MKTYKAPDVLLRQWLHSEDAITTLAFIICPLFLAISAWLIIRNLRHNEPGLKAPMVLPLAILIALPGLYGAGRLPNPWCFVIGILVCAGACVRFPFADHRRYVRDQNGQIIADRWAIVLHFGGFS